MVTFWTRLPHYSGVVSDGGVESYLKTTRHTPVDRYGQVGRALCPYSSELGVHAGELLIGSRPGWSPNGSVSFRSLAVSGSHGHVIRPQSGLLLLLRLHLLLLAEKLILNRLVRWVASHGDTLRRSGGMNGNYQNFRQREITWERMNPSSHVSPLRFLSWCFSQTTPTVASRIF